MEATWFDFDDVDRHTKASYGRLYESLPAPGTIKIESSKNVPSQQIPYSKSKPLLGVRLKVGHSVSSTLDTQLDNKVYAYITVEGNPSVMYYPVTASNSIERRDGAVVWDQPFAYLDDSSGSPTTRRKLFRIVVLYYLMASGELDRVRAQEATFHRNLKTICFKVSLKEQVRQAQQAEEPFSGTQDSQSNPLIGEMSQENELENAQATMQTVQVAPRSKSLKRAREEDDNTGGMESIRSPNMPGSRSVRRDLCQETDNYDQPSFVHTFHRLDANYATLKVQIELLQSKQMKDLEAARMLPHSQEDVQRAQQTEKETTKTNSVEAEHTIQDLHDKTASLQIENQELKDANQSLKDEVFKLKADNATLKMRTETLEKEVHETREKALAYIRKMKEMSLEF